MDDFTASSLLAIAQGPGTPSYVYFARPIRHRVFELQQSFGENFDLSFAVKSNPNREVLRLLHGTGIGLDVSSLGEVKRGLDAGFVAGQIGFSGPAKRRFEIEGGVSAGIGEFICESLEEVKELNRVAASQGVVQAFLLRINPSEVPRQFGLHMGGRPSQFGIDEESMAQLKPAIAGLPSVRLKGFHIFSGGNSLHAGAIIENLANSAALFRQFSELFEIAPEKLIFGAGFGIPYFEGDEELDLSELAAGLNPIVASMRACPRYQRSRFVLEMGRFLVGSFGYLLTSVVGTKQSRGTDIRLCDAGFNNHLSAAGMMGSVMRRDWRFWNLSRLQAGTEAEYLLVGPLCASFDILGAKVRLAETSKGDVLAVGSSGAYGLTASPTRFISHPEPQEFLVDEVEGNAVITDVTESQAHCPGVSPAE
jgi:diaminopimelate decarboxylase